MYGTLVKKYGYSIGETSVLNRTVEVYETKTKFKVLTWNSGFLYWKTNHKPINETSYSKKDFPTFEQIPQIQAFKTLPNFLEH